jgi:hypothetical protein
MNQAARTIRISVTGSRSVPVVMCKAQLQAVSRVEPSRALRYGPWGLQARLKVSASLSRGHEPGLSTILQGVWVGLYTDFFVRCIHRVAIPMWGMSCDFVYRHCLLSLILFILFILICFLLHPFSLRVLLDLAMGHEKLKGISAGDTRTQGIL